jgi:quinolinate synthase
MNSDCIGPASDDYVPAPWRERDPEVTTRRIETIRDLARRRNAVILAHNYQLPEVQEAADFVGDSLGLAMNAQATGADLVVFCGVHFMAESARILNPTKTVLLPTLAAATRSRRNRCCNGKRDTPITPW